MPHIKLNYLYRDYANYKNYGEVIFVNPDNLGLEHMEATLRANLIDGEWFYASRWGVPDLHFDKYDDENDHACHEFESVELTDEAVVDVSATLTMTINEFLKRVIAAGNSYL